MRHLASRSEGIRAVMKKAELARQKGSIPLTRAIKALSILTAFCVFVSGGALLASDGVRSGLTESDQLGMSAVQSLHAIARGMVIIDGAENALLATGLEETKREGIYSRFDATEKSLSESVKTCESLPWSQEEARVWEDFVRAFDRWRSDHKRFSILARAHERNRTAETYRSLFVQALEVNPASLSEALSLLDTVIEVSNARLEERTTASEGALASHQEAVRGVIAVAVSLSAVTLLIVLLVRRARRHRKLFQLGNRRLILNVDRYRQLSSYVHPTKQVGKSP